MRVSEIKKNPVKVLEEVIKGNGPIELTGNAATKKHVATLRPLTGDDNIGSTRKTAIQDFRVVGIPKPKVDVDVAFQDVVLRGLRRVFYDAYDRNNRARMLILEPKT